MDQLAADCALLEELRVMDYSLLLGVHYRSTGWASSPPATDKVLTLPTPLLRPDMLRYFCLSAAHTLIVHVGKMLSWRMS